MDKNKGEIKHKIGWCSNCGWVHDTVRPYTMVEDGHTTIKSICSKCRKKDREDERLIICACCGLVRGDTIYPTTVERLVFEEINSCNFIVPLCKKCRETKPHEEIREQLKLDNSICNDCQDRFKCWTGKHDKPAESYKRSGDPLKFHRNPKVGSKRRWF